MCVCWRDSPVELIDVLYVSKQVTYLLWANGKITHINNVGQVVLEKSTNCALKVHFYLEILDNKSAFDLLPAGGARTEKTFILIRHMNLQKRSNQVIQRNKKTFCQFILLTGWKCDSLNSV